MPREGFARKSEKAGRAGMRDFYLMTPDEPTAAMQDPEELTTGGEPMTGPQRSYLPTLCREAGEEFNA